MTQTQDYDYSAWEGHEVVDSQGDKIGKVAQIYIDDQTSQPAWVTVSTGLFGKKNTFVPIQGTAADGDRLITTWDKDRIKNAPNVDDGGDGHLSPEEEQELYRYYGYGKPAVPESGGEYDDRPSSGPGRDVSGPNTDTAMTRSEEELRVGTQTVETGRARLRKYIVTEQVTQTVPVSHEEVRIEREPITEANRDAALSGQPISEEEHEVILHEERPVVQKEVVAKERVRLDTQTVAGEAEVHEELRQEQIDTDGLDDGEHEAR